MITPENPFLGRTKERAELYKRKTMEFFQKILERTKRALRFLGESPFYASALAVEGGIATANKGKDAVRLLLEAIKTGGDKAKELGRNKKEQATNFLRSIVEATKNKIRDAREALVKSIIERVGQIKEKKVAREIESIDRLISEYSKRIYELNEKRRRLLSQLESLERFKPSLS
jgi:vacuolar-type H+-ATPase subunit I/STV1